ncbi:MAG: beta-ketoacyl synthase [Pirellulales bacterium]
MNRSNRTEVVITGVGIASPIGIGFEAFARSLADRRSGVKRFEGYGQVSLPAPFGGTIDDFEPKRYVRPRKSLKVMSREIQLAFCAADLAHQHAGLATCETSPERLGVVFGADMMYCDLMELTDAYRSCMPEGTFDFSRWGTHALGDLYPLWLLKYLPNMAACHIGIAHDARGPTNAITLGDVSGLLALIEGTHVIERGHADVMIVGGTSTRVHPTLLASRGSCLTSCQADQPARACRPFDQARDGMVHGEGAGALVIESLKHARRRGATILAVVKGSANRFEPRSIDSVPSGKAIRHSIEVALSAARLQPDQVGHVNANGLSTPLHDRLEAAAIRDCLGNVPVTAPKSFFGNLGSGGGAVEIAASLLAFETGKIPVTLNYETPDPECPVRVVHTAPLAAEHPTALVLNQSISGQAVSVVLARPDWQA